MKAKNGQTENQGTERNINLTPLKILIFSFFGALQCGFTYLPNQMIQLGIGSFEVRILILTTSIIALVGVLLIGFLLDFIARRNPGSIGKWLKVLLILSLLGTAVCYLILALFPTDHDYITKSHNEIEKYTFSCNETDATITSEKDSDQKCPTLIDYSHFKLSNCAYNCRSTGSRSKRQAESFEYDYEDSKSSENNGTLVVVAKNPKYGSPEQMRIQYSVGPPHICHNESIIHCHVYMNNSMIALRNVSISSNISDDSGNCQVPLDGFSCRVPTKYTSEMSALSDADCDGEIICDIIGENFPKFRFSTTEYIIPYVILVTFGEMLPAIVVLLLTITLFISTREMETQRGIISRQWIFFPLGVLTFSTVLGILNHLDPAEKDLHFYPFITFAIVSLVCVIVVLFSRSIFNSPCVWWWHTKCGMLAVPMSSLKKYRWLIFSFAIACFISGVMWNVLESWRQIILMDLIESELGGERAKTFVYIFGALCAVPVILNGEIIVDIIGHPHIIVLTLLTFAIRFTGLSLNYLSPCNTFYEFLEPLSYYLSWFGYLLIIRHYIPKKFLCGGSGIFIAVYFLLGRAIGFCFGASTDFEEYNQSQMFLFYAVFTVCAATLFFVVYHCLTYVRSEVNSDDLSRGDHPDGKSEERVFHDERSKKGYFRY